MPSLLSRTSGALLSLHAGDSLGATVEFSSHAFIAKRYPGDASAGIKPGLRDIVGGGPFSWPVGHATDDTDMTRAVLLAYCHDQQNGAPLSTDSLDIVRRAADFFLAWRDGKPWPDREPGSLPEDMGGATREGLRKYSRTRDLDNSGAGHGSAGNGSLMRCLPTGLARWRKEDEALLVDESARISAVTHNDPRCVGACVAYNVLVSRLLRGETPEDAVDAAYASIDSIPSHPNSPSKADIAEIHQAIEAGRSVSLASLAKEGPSSAGKDLIRFGCRGFVLESLILAVAAVLDSRCLEDVLVDVVRIGGDTDTNGAIAGGVLGARDGLEAIPQRWRDKLQFREEFTDLAAVLVNMHSD